MENNKIISFNKLSSLGLLDTVRRELIRYEIIRDIEINHQEMNIVMKNWCDSMNIKNRNDLEKWQKENLQSNKDWEDFILRDIKWNIWCKKKFKNKIPNFYKSQKDLLDKYIYSIIRVKNEGLSRELYLRIKEKESDFSILAREFSEGIEKKTGGLIGPVTLNNPHPKISGILKLSQNNQLWEPKKINDWWVIIRLEEKIIAKLNDELIVFLSKELGDQFLDDELLKLKKII